jgi:prepilin-type processing-associated H-X9-DG protein
MSETNNSSEKPSHKALLRATVGIVSVMVVVLYVYLFHVVPYRKRQTHLYDSICQTNLTSLGKAMAVYASEYSNEYPAAQRWCDLLAQGDYAGDKQFVCMAAAKAGYQGRCHYAMNPDCEPNSPGDMVLLFETKGGWNQSGGPEMLTTENHKPNGCNILFNDGSVKFVKMKDLEKLKWKVEEGEELTRER